MREADFQAEIARSVPWLARELGREAHYLKIPDLPRGPGQRFCPRRGYDCFIVDVGIHHALELKMCHGTSVAFKVLDEYQENQLVSAELAGGRSFVVVNFRVTFSDKQARARGTDRAILTFALPIFTWQEWRREDCSASIPLAKLEEQAIMLPRLRLADGIGWDLRPIIGGEG